jgi:hypothetical protein
VGDVKMGDKVKNKLVIINYLENLYSAGMIEDDYSLALDDFNHAFSEVLRLVSKQDNRLAIELENKFMRLAETAKHKFFNFGMIAEDLLENVNLEYSPRELDLREFV